MSYIFFQNCSIVAINVILLFTKTVLTFQGKKRHMRDNKPFTLSVDSHHKFAWCKLCHQHFTCFRYESAPYMTLDIRCASSSDKRVYGSHPNPLYYYSNYSHSKPCSRCGERYGLFGCDECDYILEGKCALYLKR